MMSRLACSFVLMICFWNMAWATDDTLNNQQRPIVLTSNSSKVLPMPVFSAETGPQCDSGGNLYFNTGFSAKSRVVLKLDTSDGSTTVFRPRDASAAETYFVAFHVTAEPKIAILVGGKNNEPYVYEFDENDPVNAHRISLEVPDGLNALTVQGFIVLPNQRILLQGYFDDAAPKERRNHGYVAEFAPSGKLLELSLEKASSDVLKSVAGRAAKTEASQSKDGTTFLLEADRIVVLSPAGQVERTIKLTPPEPGYLSDQLYMHRGQLVVGFYHIEDGGRPKVRYELMNPWTGEIIRIYQAAAELGNNLVCFSDEGLSFMKEEKGHVKLMNASVK
ncbi:MAG: hypothetical protein WA672_08315 [Candidatus Angelobacter sp.]